MTKQTAFDQLPFPIAFLDSGGELLSANRLFLRQVGAGRVDVRTLAIDRLIASDQHDVSISKLVARCIDRMETVLLSDCYELRSGTECTLLLTPDQTEPYCSVQIVPGYVAELESAETVAGRRAGPSAGDGMQQRLDFLSGISHQLRTPVNGVLGIADLLAETPLNDQQSSYVEILSRSCNSLVNLVNEIQSLALLEQGVLSVEPAQLEVRSLAEDALDLYAVTGAHQNVASVLRISDDVPASLVADGQKIHQVLVILLGNAFQYTDQGRVTLEVAYEASADQPKLTLTVADTGIGIAKERLPALFNIDRSEEQSPGRRYSNTGLGLILCHKLVALLDGDIQVESKLGHGSRFIVTVPVAAAHADAPEAAAHAKAVAGLGSGQASAGVRWNILLAEDNPINQTLFSKILERYGHAVTVVDNGQEAVAKVQMGAPYDVILMDVSMPVMDGLDATAMIRSLYGDIGSTPILALTAHAMDGDREKFINAGMDGYQSKPVDPMTLMKAIADAIESRKERLSDEEVHDSAGAKERAQSARPEYGLESLRRFRE